MSVCDATIIGAGPYGLSAASHLRTVKGFDVRVFGRAMSFWDLQMPRGMFLRSNWTATEIASPNSLLSLEGFQQSSKKSFGTPVPLDCFVEYGRWYQQQAVPDLDQREVIRVEKDAQGFRLTLSDGEFFHCRRVIVAAGIGSFARRPPEFSNLPPSLASHTSEHREFSLFAGQRVLVVGGGQSALESAALLHENGCEAEVISRSRTIHWLQGWASKTLHHGLGKSVRRMLYAPTDVGPAGLSQLLARPDWVRRLPRSLQDRLRKRAVRPAGARWLVDRLQAVPIRLGVSVKSVSHAGDQVKVSLDDGSERTVDHVLLGTGYRVDVFKYRFLSEKLKVGIRSFQGFPILKPGLETSVDGLHIVGAPAAWSFGPLMQFVSGTHYVSQALLRTVFRQTPISSVSLQSTSPGPRAIVEDSVKEVPQE